MKRAFLVICISAVFFSVLSAQTAKNKGAAGVSASSATIRLENDTSALVYYTLVEAPANDLKLLGTDSSAALEKLRSSPLQFLSTLASNGSLSVSDKEVLIIGVSIEPGSPLYPLWTLRVPAKSSRQVDAWFLVSQSKVIQSGGKSASVGPFDIEFPAVGVRIDGGFVDWLNTSDTLSFVPRSAPTTISQNIGNGSVSINSSSAMFWRRGGTDIEHFKILKTTQELDIMIASYSGMNSGLSYLMRVFDANSKASNAYSFEIPVLGKGGPVILWTKGVNGPTVVGDFAVGDYYAEARVKTNELPLELQKLLSLSAVIELSSSYREGGVYEEYYFSGRIPLSAVSSIE